MESSSSFDERSQALLDVMRSFGFNQFVYLSMKDGADPAKHNASNFVMVDHRKPTWVDEYESAGLAAVDPVRIAMQDQFLPLLYEDVPIHNASQKRFMDRSECDGNQTNGVGFVIEAGAGRQCGFATVERDEAPTPALSLAVLAVAKVFHIFAEAEFTTRIADELAVSVTDLRILHATKMGGRPAGIAEEFGLSEGYIYNRLLALRTRFNCATNARLVASLTQLGLLR